MNDMASAVLCDKGVVGGYRRGVVVGKSLGLVGLVSFDKIGELSQSSEGYQQLEWHIGVYNNYLPYFELSCIKIAKCSEVLTLQLSLQYTNIVTWWCFDTERVLGTPRTTECNPNSGPPNLVTNCSQIWYHCATGLLWQKSCTRA